MKKFFKVTTLITIGTLALTGCAKRVEEAKSNIVEVNSSDNACELSQNSAPAGNVVFRVTNSGSKVTEFYVLKEDKKTILSEVENIGADLTRDLVVQVEEGKYFVNCKPGMSGDGLHAEFTATANANSAIASEDAKALENAAALYKEFVLDQTNILIKETEKFVKLYLQGDVAAAKALYPAARMYWERIEPVAESFGDIDPLLDLREADLEEGQEWTGWHLFEKDLWQPKSGYTPLSLNQKKKYTDHLIATTKSLYPLIESLDYKVFQMGNGAKELLDEVATGKITGEEEIWSGTDLWDFQANVEGAKKVFDLLEPVVTKRDSALSEELKARFADVFGLLATEKSSDGFTTYSKLSKEKIREMAVAVDALGEPLSKLTAVVVG